ncbi:unnamed protein product [Prorocentrum cordatum]|uniref:Uncharacterized protein n=1 Tax=Prorocentrum cordatum TaxID=2364126 RepID=A0ABN9Q904_9DINO|nr:unnamed protein product [Polarella glacialis]
MAVDNWPIGEKALPPEEKARLKTESARIRALWFPSFADSEMETRYVATMVRKSIRAKLMRTWVILSLVWCCSFFGRFAYLRGIEMNSARAAIFGAQAVQAICVNTLVVLHFAPERFYKYIELDSVVAVLFVTSSICVQFTNSWRVGYMFEGDPDSLLRFSSEKCDAGSSDSLLLLSLLLLGSVAITGMRVRTRCSLFVSVSVPCIYATFSFPLGMSPHHTFSVFVHTAMVTTSLALSWTSQRNIEVEHRIDWMRTLLLEEEVRALSLPTEIDEKAHMIEQLRVAVQEDDEHAILEARRALCKIGLSNDDVDAKVAEIRKLHSERFGVSAAYLLSDEFEQLAAERTGCIDPTFYDLKDSLFFGPNALGRAKPCPRDGLPGCAIIDTLPPQHRGFCTHFLSWTWGYKLSSLRSALEGWLARSTLNPEKVFFWMCFFVNNQHRILVGQTRRGSDNLEQAFEFNLRRIGKVVAVLDTWEEPLYLTRIWTLFEQFTAINLGIEVEMALPLASAHALVEKIEEGKSGILAVVRQFSKIDCQSATACDPLDEARVKALIQTTVGFDVVENKIKGFLLCWVASAVEKRFNELVLGASSQQAALKLRKRKSNVSSLISQHLEPELLDSRH